MAVGAHDHQSKAFFIHQPAQFNLRLAGDHPCLSSKTGRFELRGGVNQAFWFCTDGHQGNR